MRVLLAAWTVALVVPAAALGWGGTYTAADGTPVRVEVANAFPVDDALPQKWVDFLGSLVHGPELAKLTLRLVPPRTVQGSCGLGALGCYGNNTIVVSPDDSVDGPTAQHVVAHEYGHHVAANRLNPPWKANDYGTKRWASYENVCARASRGELDPGDEGVDYKLNPGEAFAESYRVLNELRTGAASFDWTLVSDLLYPDATALRLLEEDVVSPWTGNTHSLLDGSFGGGAARSFPLATPYDGTLLLRLHAPPTARYRLSLWSGGRRVASGSPLRFHVCGQRALTIRVERVTGRGAFRVDVSKP